MKGEGYYYCELWQAWRNQPLCHWPAKIKAYSGAVTLKPAPA